MKLILITVLSIATSFAMPSSCLAQTQKEIDNLVKDLGKPQAKTSSPKPVSIQASSTNMAKSQKYAQWLEYQRLAKANLDNDKLPEAEKYFLLAVEEAEKKGKYIEETSLSLIGLAQTYAEEKKYTKSAETFKRAIAAMEPWIGPRHEMLIPILSYYADVLKKAGDLDGAVKIQKRAEDLTTQRRLAEQGKGDWQALLQKSHEMFKGSQLDKAEEYAKAAYEAAKSSSDIDGQSVALMFLAGIQSRNDHSSQAKASYNTLISFLKQTPNHSKFDEASAYLGLTHLQIQEKDLDGAEKTLVTAQQVIEQDVPQTKLQEANRQQLLTQWYFHKANIAKLQGKIEQSEQFMRLGREAYQKSL